MNTPNVVEVECTELEKRTAHLIFPCARIKTRPNPDFDQPISKDDNSVTITFDDGIKYSFISEYCEGYPNETMCHAWYRKVLLPRIQDFNFDPLKIQYGYFTADEKLKIPTA